MKNFKRLIIAGSLFTITLTLIKVMSGFEVAVITGLSVILAAIVVGRD